MFRMISHPLPVQNLHLGSRQRSEVLQIAHEPESRCAQMFLCDHINEDPLRSSTSQRGVHVMRKRSSAHLLVDDSVRKPDGEERTGFRNHISV